MLKSKFENLLFLLAILFVGLFVYRYLKHSHPKTDTPAKETSHFKTSPKPRAAVSTQDSAPRAPVLPVAPTTPAAKNSLPTASQPSAMDHYRELLKNPQAGLERLDLIEQMGSTETPEKLSMMAYYEVLNSGPAKEYSPEENHQRRNVVSVAFGMYLDKCLDFKACYQYAVTALARYPDREIFNDLYLQVQQKYPEDWQKQQLAEEMKRYGLLPTPRRSMPPTSHH